MSSSPSASSRTLPIFVLLSVWSLPPWLFWNSHPVLHFCSSPHLAESQTSISDLRSHGFLAGCPSLFPHLSSKVPKQTSLLGSACVPKGSSRTLSMCPNGPTHYGMMLRNVIYFSGLTCLHKMIKLREGEPRLCLPLTPSTRSAFDLEARKPVLKSKLCHFIHDFPD